MSTILPVVNLVSAVVGSTGIIDLKPTGYTSDPSFTSNKATLQIQNESGSGLLVTTVTGQTSVYIGAGAWANILLTPGESGVQWTVIYQLPNPGVTLILSTFYRPGESVPQPSTLGNSPVSVSQSPIVVTATNIVNTGNPAGTNIINAIVAGDAQAAVALTNDGILALGDALHGGGLAVVGTSTFTGRVQGDGTNNLRLDSGNVTRAIEFDVAGVQKAFVDNNGLTLNGNLNFAGSSFVATSMSLNGTQLQSTVGNSLFIGTQDSNRIRFRPNNVEQFSMDTTLHFVAGTLSKINFGFQAIASGGSTVAHGLGATPNAISIQNGSGTGGISYTVTAPGAVTFTVTPTPATATNVYWIAMIS